MNMKIKAFLKGFTCVFIFWFMIILPVFVARLESVTLFIVWIVIFFVGLIAFTSREFYNMEKK